jgi:hypothetical protein
MHLFIIMKFSLALLDMPHLVEACILNLRRKALLYLTAFNISDKHTRSALVADILLKRG